MPSSIKLYTTGSMDKAVCTAADAAATGHPKENMVDDNLDTYYKPTIGGDTWVTLDFGESESVSVFIVFFKNYKSIADGDVIARWSDNGSSWTYHYPSSISAVDTSTPLRISSWTAISHRWWGLKFNPSIVIEVAGIWFGQLFDIDQGNVLPQEDEDQFYNRVSQLPGGRLAVAGINRNRVENVGRRYLIQSSDGNFDELRNAYQDSRGRRHPLVINEGAAQNNARIVRFAEDTFPRPIRARELYEIEIRLQGVPYIDDGDSY